MSEEPIAQRVFLVDGEEVPCRFFQPKADGRDFICHYDIAWREGTKRRHAYGVDSLQALLLAMERASLDLMSARENDGHNVMWLDRLSLGMPTCVPEWALPGDYVRSGS